MIVDRVNFDNFDTFIDNTIALIENQDDCNHEGPLLCADKGFLSFQASTVESSS
ncbi:hypothetical protein [Leptodesmis sp.]|uniref:hypothetical protein n=1 Tax=Leptodesmis sp. TaxID=3100501 RepID=UPI0040535B13